MNLFGGYGYYNDASILGIILIVALALGIIGGIVMLFVFLPSKKEKQYTGFSRWLYRFLNFSEYWLPSIIKVMCFALMFALLVTGILAVFIVSVVAGLLLIVMAALIRLAFEVGFLLYSMRAELQKSNEYLSILANRSECVCIDDPPTPSQPLQQEEAIPAEEAVMEAAQAEAPAEAAPEAPEDAKAEAPAAPAPVQVAFCANCGSRVAPDSVFCIQCGHKVR